MPADHDADQRRRAAIGTTRMMAIGRLQLSYCAARTRNTNSTDSAKMIDSRVAGLPLLEREFGPFETHALGQSFVGELLHRVESRARTTRREPPSPASGTDVYML